MEEVKLIGAPNFNGKNSCKPIVEIITVKDNKKVTKSIKINSIR